MSTKGERFKVGVQAAVEGFKELVNEHDLMKATNKVKEILDDYLEKENARLNRIGK